MKDLSQLTKLHSFVSDDMFLREIAKVKQVRPPARRGSLCPYLGAEGVGSSKQPQFLSERALACPLSTGE